MIDTIVKLLKLKSGVEAPPGRSLLPGGIPYSIPSDNQPTEKSTLCPALYLCVSRVMALVTIYTSARQDHMSYK